MYLPIMLSSWLSELINRNCLERHLPYSKHSIIDYFWYMLTFRWWELVYVLAFKKSGLLLEWLKWISVVNSLNISPPLQSLNACFSLRCIHVQQPKWLRTLPLWQSWCKLWLVPNQNIRDFMILSFTIANNLCY